MKVANMMILHKWIISRYLRLKNNKKFQKPTQILFLFFLILSKKFLERLRNLTFLNFQFSFFFEWFYEKVKMFRIIALAFAIAQPTVYADDHDDHHEESSPWEWIFPDEVFY